MKKVLNQQWGRRAAVTNNESSVNIPKIKSAYQVKRKVLNLKKLFQQWGRRRNI
jgi:hypothetical protein